MHVCDCIGRRHTFVQMCPFLVVDWVAMSIEDVQRVDLWRAVGSACYRSVVAEHPTLTLVVMATVKSLPCAFGQAPGDLDLFAFGLAVEVIKPQ